MEDAQPPSKEDEERHHELQEVVAERLKAVGPPRGLVQEIGRGVGHRLRLGNRGGPSAKPGALPTGDPCPCSACRPTQKHRACVGEGDVWEHPAVKGAREASPVTPSSSRS